MLAFRGIEVSHETIRQWGLKFGQEFANIIRRRLPRPGDTWHLDEVVPRIAGKTHYLWRAVDQDVERRASSDHHLERMIVTREDEEAVWAERRLDQAAWAVVRPVRSAFQFHGSRRSS